MRQKKDFGIRQVCGMSGVTAGGMKAFYFSKLAQLNETARKDCLEFVDSWSKEGLVE